MSPMRAQQDAGNSRGFSDSNEIKTQWFPLSASQATQRHEEITQRYMHRLKDKKHETVQTKTIWRNEHTANIRYTRHRYR